MFYTWRHCFPLYHGYTVIILKTVKDCGPPPPELNDRMTVRRGSDI
jgi:hypothetical protein